MGVPCRHICHTHTLAHLVSTNPTYCNGWDIEPSAAEDHHDDGIEDRKDGHSKIGVDCIAIVDVVDTVIQVKDSDSLTFPGEHEPQKDDRK